jgi:HSP20 family protein
MFTIVPYRRYLSRPQTPFNSMLSDPFFRSFFGQNESLGSGFRVDVKEQENAYLIEAELPGLNQDQINLTIEDDELVISADYQNENKQENGGRVYTERRSGHMERSFSLENIDQDNIGAEYRNGILYVTLPKAQPEQKQVRKIQVKGEQGGESKRIEANKEDAQQ